MASQRKIDALRALAERPGTPEEGILARVFLGRLEAAGVNHEGEQDIWTALEAQCRGAMSTSDLTETLMRWVRARNAQRPTHWFCQCGNSIPIQQKCQDTDRHEGIRIQIKERFKKGDRVFYNQQSYVYGEGNAPATVTGFVRPKPDNWAYLRIKMDQHKNSQAAPVYSEKGWLLTHIPRLAEDLNKMYPFRVIGRKAESLRGTA